jgi:hypothetical protein
MFGKSVTTTATRIDEAAARVPALREEDAGLERRVSELLGRQIVEATSFGAEISAARSRRAAIAAEVEELTARGDVARSGIAAAQRLAAEEQFAEMESDAREQRARFVDDLRRFRALCQELAAAYDEIVANREDSAAFMRRVRLAEKLNRRVDFTTADFRLTIVSRLVASVTEPGATAHERSDAAARLDQQIARIARIDAQSAQR